MQGQRPTFVQGDTPVSGQYNNLYQGRGYPTPHMLGNLPYNPKGYGHSYAYGNGAEYLAPGQRQIGAALPTSFSALAIGMLNQGENAWLMEYVETTIFR
jgi:hypothetical protein